MNNHSLSNFIKNNILHFIKYSFVGIGNLFFTLILYIVFLEIFNFEYKIAFTLSWFAGVFFTYFINFMWVFKPEEKITFRKRLPKYFLVFLSSYLINLLLLNILVEYFLFTPLLAQLFIIPLVVLINFSGTKFWALK